MTFFNNMIYYYKYGMHISYERAKTPKQSAPTKAGTPAGGKKGSKGPNNGGQAGGQPRTSRESREKPRTLLDVEKGSRPRSVTAPGPIPEATPTKKLRRTKLPRLSEPCVR